MIVRVFRTPFVEKTFNRLIKITFQSRWVFSCKVLLVVIVCVKLLLKKMLIKATATCDTVEYNMVTSYKLQQYNLHNVNTTDLHVQY